MTDVVAMALLAECRARDLVVSGDQRVSEAAAALLLGIAHGSLKNMRAEGRAPPHYRIGIAGSRVSYRIADLAAWIEEGREY